MKEPSFHPDWCGDYARAKREEAEEHIRMMNNSADSLLGDVPLSMQKKIANHIMMSLRYIWEDNPRTLSETEERELSLKFMDNATVPFRFNKYSISDRNTREPEHHFHVKPYFLAQLCGPFEIKTAKGLSKPMDVHIKYMARALYYAGIHPDKHAIETMDVKIGQLRYSASRFVFATTLRMDLKENVDEDAPFQGTLSTGMDVGPLNFQSTPVGSPNCVRPY